MTTISETLTKDDLMELAETRVTKRFKGVKIAAVEVNAVTNCLGLFVGVSVEFELEEGENE